MIDSEEVLDVIYDKKYLKFLRKKNESAATQSGG